VEMDKNAGNNILWRRIWKRKNRDIEK